MPSITRGAVLLACLAALALGGCGSAHSTKPMHASPATGSHDHLGQPCVGRDEARYAGEDMFCVAGRLEKKTAAMTGGHAVHARTASRSKPH